MRTPTFRGRFRRSKRRNTEYRTPTASTTSVLCLVLRETTDQRAYCPLDGASDTKNCSRWVTAGGGRQEATNGGSTCDGNPGLIPGWVSGSGRRGRQARHQDAARPNRTRGSRQTGQGGARQDRRVPGGHEDNFRSRVTPKEQRAWP